MESWFRFRFQSFNFKVSISKFYKLLFLFKKKKTLMVSTPVSPKQTKKTCQIIIYIWIFFSSHLEWSFSLKITIFIYIFRSCFEEQQKKTTTTTILDSWYDIYFFRLFYFLNCVLVSLSFLVLVIELNHFFSCCYYFGQRFQFRDFCFVLFFVFEGDYITCLLLFFNWKNF